MAKCNKTTTNTVSDNDGGVMGSLGAKIVWLGQREGVHGREAVAFGGGWVAMFIICGLIVPRSFNSGLGYELDRDVRGFHFGWKWNLVRWSWGIGGYGVNSLINQVHRFWSWGDQFGGMGREGSVSGWLTPFRCVLFQIISPTNNF